MIVVALQIAHRAAIRLIVLAEDFPRIGSLILFVGCFLAAKGDDRSSSKKPLAYILPTPPTPTQADSAVSISLASAKLAQVRMETSLL